MHRHCSGGCRPRWSDSAAEVEAQGREATTKECMTPRSLSSNLIIMRSTSVLSSTALIRSVAKCTYGTPNRGGEGGLFRS